MITAYTLIYTTLLIILGRLQLASFDASYLLGLGGESSCYWIPPCKHGSTEVRQNPGRLRAEQMDVPDILTQYGT